MDLYIGECIHLKRGVQWVHTLGFYCLYVQGRGTPLSSLLWSDPVGAQLRAIVPRAPTASGVLQRECGVIFVYSPDYHHFLFLSGPLRHEIGIFHLFFESQKITDNLCPYMHTLMCHTAGGLVERIRRKNLSGVGLLEARLRLFHEYFGVQYNSHRHTAAGNAR